jgi:HK97 family phage major capsid protein
MLRSERMEKKRDLINQMRDILDKAEKEKRDLDASEVSKHRELERRFDEIHDGEIAEAKEEERQLSQYRNSNYHAGIGNNSNMHNKDLKSYSILKAIDAAARDRKDGFECEISNDIAKRTGRAPAGIYVPLAALTVGTPGTGGNLVPEFQGDFIDALRPRLVMGRVGATILSNLTGDVALPRQVAASTASWAAETGDLDEQTPEFDQVTLRAKRVGAWTQFSKQLLVQTDGAVGAIVKNDLISAIAIAIDRAAIYGTGQGNEPLGILSHPDTLTHEMIQSDARLSFQDVARMIQLLAEADAEGGSIAWVTNPKVRADLQARMFDAGSGLTILDKLTGSNGVGQWEFSTQVPSNLGTGNNLNALIYGDFSQVLIGSFGEAVDLVIDPYSRAVQGITRIVAHAFVDVAIRRGERFVTAKDIAVGTLAGS